MGKSVTQTTEKADNKLGTKKQGAGSDGISKKPGRKGKDPNMPKRPPSAFFVFIEEFRQQFKEKHPENKSIAAVGKAAGDKWKSMSAAERAPYVSKTAKMKAEYQKNMAAYNQKQTGGSDDHGDESDKPMSEVNGEDEDDESGDLIYFKLLDSTADLTLRKRGSSRRTIWDPRGEEDEDE